MAICDVGSEMFVDFGLSDRLVAVRAFRYIYDNCQFGEDSHKGQTFSFLKPSMGGNSHA
ncbi:MAG: hypothetical protein ACYTXC_04280 [Nostoc sp.]